MSIGGSKGKSKSTTNQTSTTSVDPATAALQTANYQRAQTVAETPYQTLSAEQIQAQYNPYEDSVVANTQADLEKQRQLAVNTTSDQATAAGAFGGSRHGVAEGITNSNAQTTAANTLAQLRQQGYTQAQNVAQTENANANNYTLQLQEMLNQALAGVQGSTTTTGSGTTTAKTGSSPLNALLSYFGTNAQLAGSVMGA